jgi:acetyl-CoA hydrolase
VNWAVVEASDLTPVAASFCRPVRRFEHVSAARRPDTHRAQCAAPGVAAGNARHLRAGDPPARQEIPIYQPSDRIGSPICIVDPKKIAGVVLTDLADETQGFDRTTAVTDRIGQHIADFLVAEMRAGRVPADFLPLQSGVGNVANSVLAALGGSPDVPSFEMYTEVLQDSVVPLLENGRCRFASTCALALSPAMMSHVAGNIGFFNRRIVLRPQEISNHPEVVRRRWT